MNRRVLLSLAGVVALFGSLPAAYAVEYRCPAPGAVACVPAQKSYGAWQDNGGAKTGNMFSPNNTCANVINLPNGNKRLMCCYAQCGVLFRDVQASQCMKTSEGQFICN